MTQHPGRNILVGKRFAVGVAVMAIRDMNPNLAASMENARIRVTADRKQGIDGLPFPAQ
jgi:hypothetical protein